jgi:adenylylsulfate kinase
MVIWLIGLSGSGKTTLGRELARQWRAVEPNTVLLDGDEVREVFGDEAGADPYSVEGRRRNAQRITALCALLDRQSINVVCCILSIFPEQRALNRQRFARYFEVFMDAPLEALERRDVKGLYAAARAGRVGNVVGVHIPFPAPGDADLVIDTSGPTPDIAALAGQVLERAKSK